MDKDFLDKKDLDTILEVNKKAVQLETEVLAQNEEIIELLNEIASSGIKHDEEISEKIDDIDDKFAKKFAELEKSMFEIKALFAVGIVNVIIQIIMIFKK